jgi:TatD DNase family protein
VYFLKKYGGFSMSLVDVHAHYEELSEDMLSDYGFVIQNGIDKKTNDKYLAQSCKKIKVALGFHPLSIDEDLSEALKELGRIKTLVNNNVVAIGEIGLDYYHVKEKNLQELQREIFKRYLQLAKELKLPVIVHARNAGSAVLDMLESFSGTVILHCFEASAKNIEIAIKKGYYFTIPASVERQELFQRLVEMVPLDKMLTETDAPYQGPIKGVSAKPSDIRFALKYIAKAKGLDEHEVENIILSNYLRVF